MPQDNRKSYSLLIVSVDFRYAFNGRTGRQKGMLLIATVIYRRAGPYCFQAYIIGKSDQQYASMVSQIQAMVFLGTPHRGSADAEFLNHILRITPGFSSGIYVSELEKTSTTLQDINEQFRTACGDLRLVSLYETQKTHLGLGVKKLVSHFIQALGNR